MEELKKYREQIAEGLDELKNKTQTKSRLEAEALELLVDFAVRGKLIRGCIIMKTAEHFGYKGSDSLKAAIAMELAHSALLIHDDVMDNDDIRRGKDSIHIYYSKRSGDPHHGISMAITVGDIAFFIAIRLLSQISAEAVNTFSEEIISVGAGQLEDLESSHKEYSDEEILEYYRLKTARYTFCLPLKLGAIIAGVRSDDLEDAGDALGILYQLRDDYLGIFGNQEILGKPVGSDLLENKKNWIVTRILKSMDSDERARLQVLKGAYALSFVETMLDKYCIRQKIEDDIELFRQSALSKVKKSSMASFLEDVLDYIITRKK